MKQLTLASLLLLGPALLADSAEIAWPQREGSPHIQANELPQPYNFAADMAARGEQSPVQLNLNFDKSDLVEVIDRFAFLLGNGTEAGQPASYILHSGVKGEVTLQIQRNFTRRQAWGVFEHMLYSQGAHCIVRNDVLHILPVASAPRHPDSKPTFVKDPS